MEVHNEEEMFELSDFMFDTQTTIEGKRKSGHVTRPIVIFGKKAFNGDDHALVISIDGEIPIELFGVYIVAFHDYIEWLGDCKNILELYYSSEFSERFTNEQFSNAFYASWYDSLTVLGATVFVEQDGRLSAVIRATDAAHPEQMLMIEFNGREIIELFYETEPLQSE